MDNCNNCGREVDFHDKNLMIRPVKLHNGIILCQDCYHNKKTWVARDPKLGETLHCGIRGNECGRVDGDYIEKHRGELKSVYDAIDDWFLGYDGCEEPRSWEQ